MKLLILLILPVIVNNLGCSFFYKLLGAAEISLPESPILTIVPVNNENAVNEVVNTTNSSGKSKKILCSFFTNF